MSEKEKRIEQGTEAGGLLLDPLFLRVVAGLKAEYTNAIIQNAVGSLTSHTACAKLQVLNDVLKELTAIKNDGSVAKAESKK